MSSHHVVAQRGRRLCHIPAGDRRRQTGCRALINARNADANDPNLPALRDDRNHAERARADALAAYNRAVDLVLAAYTASRTALADSTYPRPVADQRDPSPTGRAVLQPHGINLQSVVVHLSWDRRFCGTSARASFPHRSLSGQGDGAEPDGGSIRQLDLRTVVEQPAQ